MKIRQDILIKIKEIQQEIKNMPYICLLDDEGECDEDAYQERLEQGWRKDELYQEIDSLNAELDDLKREDWKECDENEIYEMSCR